MKSKPNALWHPLPTPAGILARLPSILEMVDRANHQLRLAVDARGGNVAGVDPAALAAWAYAMGLAQGWIYQGGHVIASNLDLVPSAQVPSASVPAAQVPAAHKKGRKKR